MLRVLPVEGLERFHQLLYVQIPIRPHVPRHLLHQPGLSCVGKLAGHHLGVNRVGHANRILPSDQPEVAHVLDVARVLQVRRRELPLVVAPQQRLDHPPHPVLVELVGELVEVRLARQDQLLLRVENGRLGDWTGARSRPASPRKQARSHSAFTSHG